MTTQSTFKIFYSWQSDLPNSTNRKFIEEALEIAAKAVRSDDTVEVEPVVDRDTQGVAGAPNIATTILGKIEDADMFVCDVSFINQQDDQSQRLTPNPNVLVELGYALKALGSKRVVLVQNTLYGGPELLPFDLKMNRITTYSVSKEESDKASKRKSLAKTLEEAIKLVVAEGTKQVVPVETPGDKIKRLLSTPNEQISTHDYLMQEADKLMSVLFDFGVFNYDSPQPLKESFLERTHTIEEASDNILQIFAEGCRWTKDTDYIKSFGDALAHLCSIPESRGQAFVIWQHMAHYAASLAFYAGGIAALSRQNYTLIKYLTLDLKYSDRSVSRKLSLIEILYAINVLHDGSAKLFPGLEKHYVPASEHIYSLLRPYFKKIIPNDNRFDELFDQFEYLISMLYAITQLKNKDNLHWVPPGIFLYRSPDIIAETQKDLEEKQEKWQPFAAGLFDIPFTVLLDIKTNVDQIIQSQRERYGIWLRY